MASANNEPVADSGAGAFDLTIEQQRYFELFGYLHLRKVFSPTEMGIIDEGFEDAFRERADEIVNIEGNFLHDDDRVHTEPIRYGLPFVAERSSKMAWLPEDPRVDAIARALVGSDYEPQGSDGSIYFCETSWHPDVYKATQDRLFIKLAIYLEPLDHHSGGVRLLPGTHFRDSEYSKRLHKILYRQPQKIEEYFGIPYDALPSVTVETDPGDILVWNYRILHASFYGGPRRRLLSLNFAESSTS